MTQAHFKFTDLRTEEACETGLEAVFDSDDEAQISFLAIKYNNEVKRKQADYMLKFYDSKGDLAGTLFLDAHSYRSLAIKSASLEKFYLSAVKVLLFCDVYLSLAAIFAGIKFKLPMVAGIGAGIFAAAGLARLRSETKPAKIAMLICLMTGIAMAAQGDINLSVAIAPFVFFTLLIAVGKQYLDKHQGENWVMDDNWLHDDHQT